MLSSWGDGSGCFSLFSFSLSSLALASASGLTSSSTSSTLRSWSWMSFTSQVCSGCLRWGGCVQRWLRKHQQHLPPTGIIGTTLFANLLDPSLDWSFHAIGNNSRTMRWVRIIKSRNIKLILIVKTQFLIQRPFHVYRSFLKYTYMSLTKTKPATFLSIQMQLSSPHHNRPRERNEQPNRGSDI